MNNQQEKNFIAEKVLDKIKSGEVKMKSRAYFVLRAVLLILGILVLTFFLIYFISFIIFSLRASGALFLPKFGFSGMKILFNALPWLLILIAATLIISLEIFAKRFTFVYRRPIIYSLLVIIIIVAAGSFLIDKTGFHPNLFRKAQERRLPAIGIIYRDFGAPRIGNAHHGVIFEVIKSGFKIETPCGEELTIIISSKTHFPLKADIKKGDVVVVLGKRSDGAVQAIDIRKVNKGRFFRR
ncbi:hypothetical protein KAS79_02315 [Candidatus Parcubacteria bacterium]|nr:hypothetical protein [Candidatus Parcubacteria bacterium]